MNVNKNSIRIKEKPLSKKVEESVSFIKKNISDKIDFSIFLGSGFNIDRSVFNEKTQMAYTDVPFFIKPKVKTHKGILRYGELGGKNILIFHGRIHSYEGYNAIEIAYNSWVAATLSLSGLIFTSLVGGINSNYKVGDFVFVSDHINFSGINPIIMSDGKLGNRFVDMLHTYNEKWIEKILGIAKKKGIRAHKGILAFLTGPNFETRAELNFLKSIKADIVGWSIIPDVLAARQVGKKLIGISCISDMSDPVTLSEVDLDSIWKVGLDKTPQLFELMKEFLLNI